MNGLSDAEWNQRRLSGPVSKRELLNYLRKTGQLPPEGDVDVKQAS